MTGGFGDLGFPVCVEHGTWGLRVFRVSRGCLFGIVDFTDFVGCLMCKFVDLPVFRNV